jgi:hypothetical protein
MDPALQSIQHNLCKDSCYKAISVAKSAHHYILIALFGSQYRRSTGTLRFSLLALNYKVRLK